MDQCPDEFDDVSVVEVDAEIEAVEKAEGILFDVAGVIANDIYDLLVQQLLLFLLLLHQPIGFLKCIKHLVMEVNFLPKLRKVLLPNLIVNLIMYVCLQLHHLDIVLDRIYLAIIIKIILRRIMRPIMHSRLMALLLGEHSNLPLHLLHWTVFESH